MIYLKQLTHTLRRGVQKKHCDTYAHIHQKIFKDHIVKIRFKTKVILSSEN